MIDPLLTFILATYDFCIKGFNEDLTLPFFGKDHIDPYLSVAFLIVQVILYFWINIAVDHHLRNKWR